MATKEGNSTQRRDGKTGYSVIMVYADSASEWNCSQWRSLTPSNAMNRAAADGWHGKLVHVSGFLDWSDPAIQDLVGPADVIVFQRNVISPQAYDAMEYWQGMGKPVVIDLDDSYQTLPWSNPAHQFWHIRPFEYLGEQQPGGAIKALQEGLRRCNGLVSPNRLLLHTWSHVTRHSYYLQNYAEPDWWSNLPDREALKKAKGLEGRTVIGWGGSVSHYDSWWGSGIREAARRVCERHPEVLWMICGNDDRIYSQLPVPDSQKYHQPGVPPEKWPQIVRHFDIGVAPLFGPYDQNRSWIKGIEYMLAAVPWIGQAGEPYGDIAHLGTLIPPSAGDWEAALEGLLARLPSEQERAAEFVETARQMFVVDNQLDAFAAVYKQIKADFTEDFGRLPGVYRVKKEEATEATTTE